MKRLFSCPKSRRYTAQGLVALAAVGLGGTLMLTSLNESSLLLAQQSGEAGEAVAPLDPVTYSNAMLLRRRAALGDKDLAALDLTQEEAESVLSQIVSWCEANERALAEAERSEHAAKRALALQNRRVRIGEASEGELVDADGRRAAVQQAEQARNDLMRRGAAQAMQASGLASGKVAAWERLLAVKGQITSDVRYIPAVDASRLDQLRSEARRERVALENVLSFSEREALGDVRQRIAARMAGVQTARETAMPLPDALRAHVESDELVPEEE